MRLERILVGIDFSPESEVALRHAAQLARTRGARLILCHVLPHPSDLLLVQDSPYDPLFRAQAPPVEIGTAQREQATELLQDVEESIAESGVEVEVVLIDDNPSDGLARAADEVGAQLLVVGTHGRTGLQRFLMGSVAERAIRLASVHAMVARGDVDRDHQRILVATDFSPAADAALEAARSIAPPTARIEVVHCWQTPILPGGTVFAEVRGDVERAIVERGQRLVASANDSRLRFVAVESSAAEGIRRQAEETGCDLIAAGSHGHRGVRRLLLGSTIETIVRHAPCSVLVVRPPGKDAGAG